MARVGFKVRGGGTGAVATTLQGVKYEKGEKKDLQAEAVLVFFQGS